MPASTDYWINDRSGDPLLVMTGEVDAALTKALPRLLREVRDLVGERRVTIVFDRGGWCLMKYYKRRYWPTKPKWRGSNGFWRRSRAILNEV
jgi:hypothetical protein